jgi:hypothetical protein
MKLKERMPIWVWIIIIGAVITIAVLSCIHLFGILDLSFIGTLFLGFYMWAGSEVLNGVVALVVAAFLFGALGYYIKAYTGIKTPPVNPYNPIGATVTASSIEENKTVVS